MHLVKEPYAPCGQARTLLAGSGLQAFEPQLSALGITALYPQSLAAVPGALSTHADLAAFPMGSGSFLLAPGQQDLAEKLCALGAACVFGTARPQAKYPLDAPYNAVKIGKTLLCNPKTIDSRIFCLAKEEDCAIISCRQGYTKCAVAFVSPTALLTDDPGIARAAKPYFDVLLVQKGSVRLHGYPYGFIGGCCGLVSPDTLLFIGDWRLHEDAQHIRAFLRNYNVYAESLSNTPLTDIGSFMAVTEE